MSRFDNCSSGCKEGGHATWGECVRAKNAGLVGLPSMNDGWSGDQQKAWDSRIAEARAASRQGIRPDSTRLEDIRSAVKRSDETGTAYVTER